MAIHIDHIFRIPTNKIDRLFLVSKPDVAKWMTISVRDIALWIYYFGILCAFFISLTPWPLWKLYPYVGIVAFLPILCAYMMSRTLSSPIFTRKDFALPFVACTICVLSMALLGRKNIFGIIGDIFMLPVFLSLFTLNKEDLVRLGDMLSKVMGVLLLLSMLAYFFYILGFSLPHFHIAFPYGDYTYENYFFFLIDDRSAGIDIPRFHSIFLEPSHMSMACVALLLTQIGRWKKWYNFSILVAIVISFSLAGYIFLVVLYFASSWLRGKSIVKKVVLFASGLALIVILSLLYNGGDNMVNQLILQRLEVNEDGKLAGDNRVTGMFDSVYKEFSHSEKLLYGEGGIKMAKYADGGNAGYKVFLYTYGLISLFFIIMFFFAICCTSSLMRQKITMLIVSFISFIPHGYPLIFYFFIPLYILLFTDFRHNQEGSLQELKENIG